MRRPFADVFSGGVFENYQKPAVVTLVVTELDFISELVDYERDGGEGSRTPVLKTIAPDVYMLSRSFDLGEAASIDRIRSLR